MSINKLTGSRDMIRYKETYIHGKFIYGSQRKLFKADDGTFYYKPNPRVMSTKEYGRGFEPLSFKDIKKKANIFESDKLDPCNIRRKIS